MLIFVSFSYSALKTGSRSGDSQRLAIRSAAPRIVGWLAPSDSRIVFRRLPEKDAAVPVVFAGGQEALGRLDARLLAERLDAEEEAILLQVAERSAAMDVAVAGGGKRRRNADRDEGGGILVDQVRRDPRCNDEILQGRIDFRPCDRPASRSSSPSGSWTSRDQGGVPRPMHAAVSRPIGSPTIFAAGISGSCRPHSPR